jgi:4-hydroxybenzoate polyprenyltransferase
VKPLQTTLTPRADKRDPRTDGRIRKNTPMAIARAAWMVTVLVALITALLLLLSGYTGYAGLGLAVAMSASINLL